MGGDALQDLHDKVHGPHADRNEHPHSVAAQPVYRGLEKWSEDVVGYIFSVVAWDNYLVDLLPEGVRGIIVVLRNHCDQSITYELSGKNVSNRL
jgi:hypothetical protein